MVYLVDRLPRNKSEAWKVCASEAGGLPDDGSFTN